MKNRYLTPEMYEEFEKGINNLETRKLPKDVIRLMFRTLLSGAFRISEVLYLESSDLMQDGMIRLRMTKTGWEVCKCSKWQVRPIKLVHSDPGCNKCSGRGKYRIDQFGWVTEDVFSELVKHASSVPEGKKLFPISYRQVLNYCHQISACGTHSFRHSWLTWLAAKEDLNIEEMRTKSRHRNVGTLQIYLHSNRDLVRLKEQRSMTIPGTLKQTDLFEDTT